MSDNEAWSSGLDAEPAKGVRRGRKLLVAAIVVVVVALPAAAFAVDRTTAERLAPQTTIAGLDVGGLTAAEATAVVERELVEPLRRPLQVVAPGMDRATTAWDLGLRVDVAAAVDRTLEAQRSRLLPVRVFVRFTGGEAVALEPALDEGMLRIFLGDAAEQIDRPVREASFEVVDGWLDIRRGRIGRSLDIDGAEEALRSAIASGAAEAELPVRKIRPSEDGKRFDTAILVHAGSNKLYLYERGEIAETYRVATGMRGYSTPTGTFRITAKRKYPTWGNPGSAWAANMPRFIGPGPNNPLGTRALNLSARGIRIHGTPQANSIGTHASHGCIRMFMSEAEELFERVAVDTPVVVVRA